MLQYAIRDFDHWRQLARQLRLRDVRPDDVQLLPRSESLLFETTDELTEQGGAPLQSTLQFRVPKEFLTLSEDVAYHRGTNRWNLLYRVLWRITSGESQLMQLVVDDDIYELTQMRKSVTRDAHKMKAFVRFREMQSEAGESYFVAWHRPDHYVVQKVAPFFARRFKAMNWTIMTPDESVSWDQSQLTYHGGLPRSASPPGDELESLWRTYYANIFNPARIKLKAMRAEMPVRHWATMPETSAIDEMLRAAPERQRKMIELSEGFAQTARDFFPQSDQVSTLASLAHAASRCQACNLYCHANQVVFGQGPSDATLVLVGEQPGDQEDVAGLPFVGPAGQLLDNALSAAGIDRNKIYTTNIVKHFKHEMRGKFRLHKRPDAREVRACRPWFEAEWSALSATTLVCLGTTSAAALISPGFRLQDQRGQWVPSEFSDRTLATWHPSSILRLPSADAQTERFSQLVADLRIAQTLT